MNRPRNFSRQGSLDLDRAIAWLLDHGVAADTAEECLTAVLTAAERLAARPSLGHARSDLLPDPFRFWSMPRWKLLLVYDPTPHPATVLRVLNTARDLPPLLAHLREMPESPEG